MSGAGLHGGSGGPTVSYGFGETAAAGGSPMDFQQPGSASAQVRARCLPARMPVRSCILSRLWSLDMFRHACSALGLQVGGEPAAASHHAGHAELPQQQQGGHHIKRKMSEMGEVGGQCSPPAETAGASAAPAALGAAAAAGPGGGSSIEEVQECGMPQQQLGWQQGASAESDGEGGGAPMGFNR